MLSAPENWVGLIGDIHSQHELLEQVLHWFDQCNIHHIWAVGDIADGEGDLDYCIQLLQQANVKAVKGNHDRWLLTHQYRHLAHAHFIGQLHQQTIDYLDQLPTQRCFERLGKSWLLCHGTPHDDETGLTLSRRQRQAVYYRHPWRAYGTICGHTHGAQLQRDCYGLVVNPGTLRSRRYPAGIMRLNLVDSYAERWIFSAQGLQFAWRQFFG